MGRPAVGSNFRLSPWLDFFRHYRAGANGVSPQNNFTTRSLLVPYLMGSAGLLIHMTPDDLKEKFEERSRQLINYWNKAYGNHK